MSDKTVTPKNFPGEILVNSSWKENEFNAVAIDFTEEDNEYVNNGNGDTAAAADAPSNEVLLMVQERDSIEQILACVLASEF